jgi:hypothetical protein
MLPNSMPELLSLCLLELKCVSRRFWCTFRLEGACVECCSRGRGVCVSLRAGDIGNAMSEGSRSEALSIESAARAGD